MKLFLISLFVWLEWIQAKGEKADRILEWIKIPPIRIQRYGIIIYRENTPNSKCLYLYNHFNLAWCL